MPEFEDRTLTCTECGAQFVFTAGEQQFYHDKNFKNEPKRCKACKNRRSHERGGRGQPGMHKVETSAVCSQCGKPTTVPFKPTQGRPVFCRECFQQRRAAAAGGGLGRAAE